MQTVEPSEVPDMGRYELSGFPIIENSEFTE